MEGFHGANGPREQHAVADATGDGILAAFEQQVDRRSADALVVAPGRSATVAEIDAWSIAVAKRLQASRVPPESLIGLAAPNGPAFLAGFLAIRRAGHAALLLDHGVSRPDRQLALDRLEVSALLECEQGWPTSERDFRISELHSERRRSMRGIAVVKLTSGSTGAPRGVAIGTDAQLADATAFASSMGLLPEDRFLATIPFAHSYGFTILALSALLRGSTLVLPAEWGPFPPIRAGELLGATVFPTVPAYLQGLLQMARPPALPSGLRLVITAGALLPADVAKRFRETYGLPVHVLYGASECGGICYDREGGAAERGTVGTPLDGNRVTIAALPEDAGGDGVVEVESAAVGVTYLPDPDPRLSAGRFETCDVAVWRGAELAIQRRIDRVINVRGRKVDPSEVEAVIGELDNVSEVVVVGVVSPRRNEEFVRAVIACRSDRVTPAQVVDWCRARLAEHKVPRSVVLVDAIPRTARGKIDRAALLDADLPELTVRARHG